MTKSDIMLQNSNGSPNLSAGSPNRGARSKYGDGEFRSGTSCTPEILKHAGSDKNFSPK